MNDTIEPNPIRLTRYPESSAGDIVRITNFRNATTMQCSWEEWHKFISTLPQREPGDG